MVKNVDLTQAPAAVALASMVSRLWGRLDILIGNAAVLCPMLKRRHVADVAWLETIDTNLTANRRLLRAFDSLLRRCVSGRVVILTSDAAPRLKPRRDPYAISKAALQVPANTHALETEKTRFCVNLVDPGPLNTMRAAAVPNESRSILPRAGEVAPLVVGLAAPSWVGAGQLQRFAEWRSRRDRRTD
jgi:NAD(P)-dependent dehydrogenase (short-subunit alcohol dehydrogenase family)